MAELYLRPPKWPPPLWLPPLLWLPPRLVAPPPLNERLGVDAPRLTDVLRLWIGVVLRSTEREVETDGRVVLMRPDGRFVSADWRVVVCVEGRAVVRVLLSRFVRCPTLRCPLKLPVERFVVTLWLPPFTDGRLLLPPLLRSLRLKLPLLLPRLLPFPRLLYPLFPRLLYPLLPRLL